MSVIAKRGRTVSPVTLRYPVYELRGRVRLRVVCQDGEAASVWQRRLQGYAVKLAEYVQRKFGHELVVEWDEEPEHVATNFKVVR